MRCMGASARFSAPLSRARSPVNARAWRGREGGDVSLSRAKLVLCLGSQILNFHSRAFLKNFFFKLHEVFKFFSSFFALSFKRVEKDFFLNLCTSGTDSTTPKAFSRWLMYHVPSRYSKRKIFLF